MSQTLPFTGHKSTYPLSALTSGIKNLRSDYFLFLSKSTHMLQSMTGYGKSEGVFTDRKITVEIKSLNSKSLDLYVKIPSVYKEKEIALRKKIGEQLLRGKIEMVISIQTGESSSFTRINEKIFRDYFGQIQRISKNLGVDESGALAAILRLPEVCGAPEEKLSPDEWNAVEMLADKAVKDLIDFRKAEGKAIVAEFEKCIARIKSSFEKIPGFEASRIPEIRSRIEANLIEFAANSKVDKNRFEQELIYYLEKIDISEEKQRLIRHLDYFQETVKMKTSEGKKLGFISQEIGREMNTLGSKAYHTEIQKLVVEMKDELEKIKEQILNVL